MPCLTTAPTISDLGKTTRKKNKKQNKQKQNSTAKIQFLNLKAPRDNVKIQSD